MSGSYNTTNPYGGYGIPVDLKVYPMASGETRGACFDCPGLHGEKTSPGCANCARLKKGRADCWDPTTYVAPKIIIPEKQRKLSEKMREIKTGTKKKQNCKWPGCTAQVISGYCSKKGTPRHGQIVSMRRFTFKKDNPGKEPTLEWLHRPFERSHRKRAAEIAKKLGFKTLLDACYHFYYVERLTLKATGKKLSLSDTNVGTILKEGGYSLRKTGGWMKK